MKISDSGLVIYEELPYIAASLDLEVKCKCCGAGLVEIKCPLIRGEILSADNLGYLQNTITSDNKNTTVLKTNEPYYFQVQGQLGVTGRNYCDFFVYTTAGFHLERIFFDENLWQHMLIQFKWFWMNILCPELLQSLVKNKVEDDTNKKCNEINETSSTLTSSTKMPICKTPAQKTSPNLKRKIKKQLLKTNKTVQKPIYLCGSCKKTLPKDPQVYNDFSIGCDKCPLWYQFSCAGIPKGVNPIISGQWFCKVCKGL